MVKRSSVDMLLPRQTTPSSCIASCGPFQTASNTCNDASCFCVPAIANSLQQCMNCGLEGITDQTTLSNAEQLVSGTYIRLSEYVLALNFNGTF
ncbi:hypothetical protein CPB84DRAFT_579179 [Gymnopilus junonius]|uniref:Uncharacterized protein n=1 Tax=Gymnopilus junonius TaxID=109634 RepID=A0A9P5NAN9_GYMJU|nr:hypothetical protein CPB84DRAFT_579179 [Gymnopilus junonius]